MCSDAPAAPDYSQIAASNKETAEMAAKTAADQLAWAKDQYAQSSGTAKDMYKQYMDYLTTQLTNNQTATTKAQDQAQESIDTQGKVVDDALARAKTNDANAATDRQYYLDTYRPLETKAAKDALDFASPDRKANEQARAGAGVAQAFDQQRQGALANLESFGIDPSSTRYAALDTGYRAQKAAAMAGAMNQTGQSVDAQGRALVSDAINVGKGYAGTVAQTYGTALASGNQASGAAAAGAGAATGAAGTQFASLGSGAGGFAGGTSMLNGQTGAAGTYGSLMGTGPQWAGIGNQAQANWANTTNMGFQNQLASSQASSGIGSILGFASSIPGLAEGGAIPDGSDPNVVPTHASPSRGAIPDDVPARVEPGEYVVPKDVVRWKGEEFFQKTIDTSRKARAGATAKPQMKPPLPNVNPSYVSRGAAGQMMGAIPA